MPLSDCKIHLELKWNKKCILFRAGTAAKFIIEDTKLYVSIITLSTKDNVKLTTIKRWICWNKYLSHNFAKAANTNIPIRIKLDAAF